MKKLVFLIFVCVNTVLFAQAPCNCTTANINTQLNIKYGTKVVDHYLKCVDATTGKVELADPKFITDTLIDLDTLESDVAKIQFLRIGLPVYTTGDLASIGTGGAVGKCMTCDSIRDMADTIYSSPWTYNGNLPTDVVLRFPTKKVGIGTTQPTANLHILGRTKTNILTIPSAIDPNDSIDLLVGEHLGDGLPDFKALILTDNDADVVGISSTYAAFGEIAIVQGNVHISTVGNGIIEKSPNGNCWKLTPSNAGLSVWTSIPCP